MFVKKHLYPKCDCWPGEKSQAVFAFCSSQFAYIATLQEIKITFSKNWEGVTQKVFVVSGKHRKLKTLLEKLR